MHAAPPVRVSLARGPGWIAAVAWIAGLAAANLAAWIVLRFGVGAGSASIVVPLAAGAAAAYAWRAQPPALLRWDGAAWLCDGVAGEVGIALDLDAWLLLRFTPAQGGARGRWIAASRAARSAAHGPSAAALYSSRRPAAEPDAPAA
jgi:hypothetical protein